MSTLIATGLRECSVRGCVHVAERYSGSCMICGNHYCCKHLASSYHGCPSTEEDPTTYSLAYTDAKNNHLNALLSKINPDELAAVASVHRGNVPCRLPAFDPGICNKARLEMVSKQCGGQNCHLDITFEDGVTWLARIRLDDPLLPPREAQNHVFLCEVATLEFLSRTSIPAPHIYHYQLEGANNPVGSSYVLMEKIPGKPLDWTSATKDQRAIIMEQLAGLYLEIEKYPLPMMGSMSLSGAPGSIGAFAQEPWFEAPDKPLGPFPTLEAAYRAVITQHLQILRSKEVSSLPLENYLSFLWRLQNLPKVVTTSVSSCGPYYLKHYDDKDDHILVDDDFNITGVIDWEFASAEPKELAFSSPCMMWPVGQFYNGSNSLSDEELAFAQVFAKRGRSDLSNLVLNGRPWQRYAFFLGGGIPQDRAEFEALFRGLRQSWEGSGQKPVASYKDCYDENVWNYLAIYPELLKVLGEDQCSTM